MDFAPSALLATWAAGVAALAGLVVWWRIVGPGFTLLACGTAVLFAAPAALAGSGQAAWVAVALAVAGALLRSRPGLSAIALWGSSAALLLAGLLDDGSEVAVVTGAAFLGGVTVLMLLGHWYLVDPRLPRWALKALGVGAALGAVADAAAVSLLGALPWAAGDGPVGIGFVLLAVASVILVLAARASLGETGYSGVMAATGLSYLAMLTATGAAVLGRLLIDGPVL
jgi:hypothetical protein